MLTEYRNAIHQTRCLSEIHTQGTKRRGETNVLIFGALCPAPARLFACHEF